MSIGLNGYYKDPGYGVGSCSSELAAVLQNWQVRTDTIIIMSNILYEIILFMDYIHG